jgi:hypothetical protein
MSDDDTYEIPLQDQRVFGAGIKRKRVKFVPSTSSSSITHSTTKAPARSISDLYLSLVLPNEASSTENFIEESPNPCSLSRASSEGIPVAEGQTNEPELCDICKLPLSSTDVTATLMPDALPSESQDPTRRPPGKPRPHEASLAHQVCLEHSHPPSHLDRNRKGLTYLSAYGWDPDARLGLGAQGQGIQFPIKPKPKDDKLGIGVVLPPERERLKKKKLEKLDAGKVRKMYEKDKRKGERLREMFYRNDDVERYLGKG